MTIEELRQLDPQKLTAHEQFELREALAEELYEQAPDQEVYEIYYKYVYGKVFTLPNDAMIELYLETFFEQ